VIINAVVKTPILSKRGMLPQPTWGDVSTQASFAAIGSSIVSFDSKFTSRAMEMDTDAIYHDFLSYSHTTPRPWSIAANIVFVGRFKGVENVPSVTVFNARPLSLHAGNTTGRVKRL